MLENKVVLGVAPTRRFIFSKEDSFKFKNLTYKKLDELKIDYIDIECINDEGLLFDECDIPAIAERFKRKNIDAIFFPHCNFGTEDVVCKLAKVINKPILLWGPRDEDPLENGSRLRDSQCGLFATGKVLRRFGLSFTYIPNDTLDDTSFSRGIKNFISAVNVVKTFKSMRILQISTRPLDFLSTMYNEGELIEKFGIQVAPIPLSDVVREASKLVNKPTKEMKDTVDYINSNLEVCVSQEGVKKIAAFKCVIKNFMKKLGCQVAAIQCWSALKEDFGIRACASNGLLTDEGYPIACETDIHGAITMVIAQTATMGKVAPMFADWTVRHPNNDNGELLQHCGAYPISLCKEGTKVKLTCPFALGGDTPGSLQLETKPGDITLLRFDGDHGQYKLLAGNAKIIEGPFIWGTYSWIEVKDWLKLEKKLVEGPYIHHCVGIHARVLPVVYEACKYIKGLMIDFYDDEEKGKVEDYLLGR